MASLPKQMLSYPFWCTYNLFMKKEAIDDRLHNKLRFRIVLKFFKQPISLTITSFFNKSDKKTLFEVYHYNNDFLSLNKLKFQP